MATHKARTSAKQVNGHHREFKPYPSYSFPGTDPIVNFTRDAFEASHLTQKEICQRSGVSPGTYYSWYRKKRNRTRRPTWATVAATLLACGVSKVDLNKIKRLT